MDSYLDEKQPQMQMQQQQQPQDEKEQRLEELERKQRQDQITVFGKVQTPSRDRELDRLDLAEMKEELSLIAYTVGNMAHNQVQHMGDTMQTLEMTKESVNKIEGAREQINALTKVCKDGFADMQNRIANDCLSAGVLQSPRRLLYCLLMLVVNIVMLVVLVHKLYFKLASWITRAARAGVSWIPWLGSALDGLMFLFLGMMFMFLWSSMVTAATFGMVNGDRLIIGIGMCLRWVLHQMALAMLVQLDGLRARMGTVVDETGFDEDFEAIRETVTEYGAGLADRARDYVTEGTAEAVVEAIRATPAAVASSLSSAASATISGFSSFFGFGDAGGGRRRRRKTQRRRRRSKRKKLTRRKVKGRHRRTRRRRKIKRKMRKRTRYRKRYGGNKDAAKLCDDITAQIGALVSSLLPQDRDYQKPGKAYKDILVEIREFSIFAGKFFNGIEGIIHKACTAKKMSDKVKESGNLTRRKTQKKLKEIQNTTRGLIEKWAKNAGTKKDGSRLDGNEVPELVKRVSSMTGHYVIPKSKTSIARRPKTCPIMDKLHNIPFIKLPWTWVSCARRTVASAAGGGRQYIEKM